MSLVRLTIITLAACMAANAQTGAVMFLGSDTSTKGAWKGVYGQDGNVIVQNSSLAPSYSVFNPVNAGSLVYNYYSTDPRALAKYVISFSTTERIASYFYTASYMDFNVTGRDAAWHRIALYFCDYENAGRSVTLQARDAITGTVLDMRVLDNYTDGVYQVYSYKGPVTFRVINNKPPSPLGTLSGLFWGGSGGPSPDTTSPSVSITSPGASAVLSGTATIIASASDDTGVAGVQFYSGATKIGAELTSPPYTVAWNTAGLPNGGYQLTAVARDGAGNTTTSAAVDVTVQNSAVDVTPPSVSILSPAGGTTVSLNTALSASASDDTLVAGVQFRLDGAPLGAEITSAPYTYTWDTTGAVNGSHQITATARDGAGHSTTSLPVTVLVSNAPPPSGTAVTFIGSDDTTKGNWKGVYGQDGNIIALHSTTPPSYSWYSLVNVNQFLYDLWSTDPRALQKYTYSYSPTERIASHFYSRFYMDFEVTTRDNQPHRIAFYFCDWEAKGRNVTVQALDAKTSAVLDSRVLASYVNGIYLVYNYSGDVIFRVKNNNSSDVTSPNATVSGIFWGGATAPPRDTAPPDVTITAPASFSINNVGHRLAYHNVSGVSLLQVNATDSNGVAGVQYQLDGVNLGPEQTSAPFGYSWVSTSVADGYHELTAVARDAANNVATSTPVGIWVVNQAGVESNSPAVQIDSISNANSLTGTVQFNATVSDDTAVGAVWWLVDGAYNPSGPGQQTTASPWRLTWDTTTMSNQSHVLTAIAWDSWHNAAVSSPVTVTIANQQPSGNLVAFLGADRATLGGWKGVYGQDGNVIPLNSSVSPSYTGFWVNNASQYLSNLWSTDPRALIKNVYSYSPGERIASYLQSVSYIDVEVAAKDTSPHRLALYFCDYERVGRSVTVQVTDGTTGAVLDTQTLAGYTDGVYLVYRYQGKVRFRVKNNNSTSGPTATLNALFFGGTP